MKKLIFNNLWWLTFIFSIVFLILHTMSIEGINIDNTTIILLLLILISPLTTKLKKIKYGEFEEIGRASCREIV